MSDINEVRARAMTWPSSYWVAAAREQSRWAVGLVAEYRAATHAKKRARLWQERRRCLDRIPVFMANARTAKAVQP